MWISTLKILVFLTFLSSGLINAATFNRLGDYPSSTDTRPTGINDANQAVGYSRTAVPGQTLHALMWGTDGTNQFTYEFMPSTGPGNNNFAQFNAINGAGQAVGLSNNQLGKRRGIVWGGNGTPQQGGYQGLLAPGQQGEYAGFPEELNDLAEALAINNSGIIVGYRTIMEAPAYRPRGVAWTYRATSNDSTPKWRAYMDGQVIGDLNILWDSTFNGISDTGRIVGWTRPPLSIYMQPAYWNAVGAEKGINLRGTYTGGEAKAIKVVNGVDNIVGYTYKDTGDATHTYRTTMAMYWPDKDALPIVLPSLGGTYNTANAINVAGHAVGTSTTPAGQKHAVLYVKQLNGQYGLYDISQNFAPILASAGFSYLEEATAINASGNIVGFGMLLNGNRAAFRIMGLFGATAASKSAPVAISQHNADMTKQLNLDENYSLVQGNSTLSIELPLQPLKF